MDLVEARQRVNEIRDTDDFERQAGDEYDLYVDFIEALAEGKVARWDIEFIAQEIIRVKDMGFRRDRLL